MLEKIVIVILATSLPLIELNGGIPLGLAMGLEPQMTLILIILINTIIFFPVLLALNFLYDSLFSKIDLFKIYLDKLRKRGKPYVDKYGLIGLTLFMALPTPLSGVYTGTLLCWVLNMNWKKSFFAIFLGVLINGLIVLGLSLGIITFSQSFLSL